MLFRNFDIIFDHKRNYLDRRDDLEFNEIENLRDYGISSIYEYDPRLIYYDNGHAALDRIYPEFFKIIFEKFPKVKSIEWWNPMDRKNYYAKEVALLIINQNIKFDLRGVMGEYGFSLRHSSPFVFSIWPFAYQYRNSKGYLTQFLRKAERITIEEKKSILSRINTIPNSIQGEENIQEDKEDNSYEKLLKEEGLFEFMNGFFFFLHLRPCNEVPDRHTMNLVMDLFRPGTCVKVNKDGIVWQGNLELELPLSK